ncbi:SMP-30/gluconolactonase/LRE family protein [Sphingomonas sp. DT-204]|uniref:SMP-30/gluconolactonase/LRE family protein n=1 Tax=Sphingomonas sp. DT-204 TaxID=3396166 RepID=UPI003F1CB5A7
MSGPAIALFGSTINKLGESPVWDAKHGWLWWVDIGRNRILAADSRGEVQRDWRFDRPAGSIGLVDGGLVAAFADGFALIDGNGCVRRLATPGIGAGAIRFNDGKTDRQGRFLAGTMQHGEQQAALATLWRLEHDGTATPLLDGHKVSNAICFSPTGDWMYFADTLEAVIRRYPYDVVTGAIGVRADLFDAGAHGLAPDGATVDADGRLWVAMVLTGQIACISADGVLLDLIDLPVPYPSCPAFGGADMRTLYVTTIADSGHRLQSDHRDAGRMLAITGLNACGIEEARYAPDNHTRN